MFEQAWVPGPSVLRVAGLCVGTIVFGECLGVFVRECLHRVGVWQNMIRGLSLPASVEETGIKASVISREHYVILWAYFYMASKTLVLQRTHLKAEYSGTVYWACVVNSLKSSATFTCISGIFTNPPQYNLARCYMCSNKIILFKMDKMLLFSKRTQILCANCVYHYICGNGCVWIKQVNLL